MLWASPSQAIARLFTSNDLQALSEYVQFRLFATVVNEGDEATVYDPVLRHFLGKLTTIQFIPAAVDFWNSQLDSAVTPNETRQYRNPTDDLWELMEQLVDEVKVEYGDLGAEYGFKLYGKGLLPNVSYGDNGKEILITPDPQLFPPAYGPLVTADPIPWSYDS